MVDSEHSDSAFYENLELLGRKHSSADTSLFEEFSTLKNQKRRSLTIEKSLLDYEPKHPQSRECMSSSSPPSTICGDSPSRFRSHRILNEGGTSAALLKTPAMNLALQSSPPLHPSVAPSASSASPRHPPSSPYLPLHPSLAPSTSPALPAQSPSPYLPSRSSDLSYRPTSSLQAPSVQSRSSQEDKDEDNVNATARAFLNTLKWVIHEVDRAVEFNVE